MKIRFLFTIALVVFLFSCKNEKKSGETKAETIKKTDNFNVTLDVLAEKDDTFMLFYTTDGSIDFTKIEPILVDIKGNTQQSQKINFQLPDGIIPTQIRLDFGVNNEQGDVILYSFTMDYKNKSRTISVPEILAYFRADESKCTFDYKTGIIKANKNDGLRMHPSLYPHELALGEEIKKIVQ